MSRQTERAEARAKAHALASKLKQLKLSERLQRTRERQTEQEKNGTAPQNTVKAMSLSRSRINSRKVQKGQHKGRMLTEHYHATKGYRFTRKELREGMRP